MKRLVSKILMLIAVLSASLSASGYDFEVDGLYYNIVSTVDRTVALTYRESVIVNGYYGGYNDYSKEVLIIPSTVDYSGQSLKVIGVDIQAFEYNTSIKKLIIPKTIQWLHQECFDECSSLEEVVIEDSESPLNFYMKGRSFYFADCPISKLYLGRNINLPSNIGRTPFAQLDKLTEVALSENVTVLTINMFSDCTSLKTIKLPNACIEIGTGAFSGCTNLTSIENTSQITKLGGGAFLNCPSLKSFVCDDLISLGGYAFQNCISISSIELGNSLSVIPENAFDGCESLSSFKVPEGITKISSYAFQNCKNLEGIIFPAKLNSVGNYAFNGCESLKSIVIDYNEEILDLGNLFLWKSDKENKIGVIEHLEINRNLKNSSHRFFNFTNVKTISIGSHVTNIDSSFDLTYASGLESISIFANTPPKTNWDFYNNLLTTVKIKVPKGTKEAYLNSDSWKGFWNIEEMNISTGVGNIYNYDLSLKVEDNSILIQNKAETSIVRIYTLQGQLVKETREAEIHGLPRGLYIVTIDSHSFKISI